LRRHDKRIDEMIDWAAVGAIATGVGALITGAALIYLIRQTNASQIQARAATQQLEMLECERERAQAEKVCVWIKMVDRYFEPYRTFFGGYGDGYAIILHIHNASDLPVYDSTIRIVQVADLGSETATIAIERDAVLPPTATAEIRNPNELARREPQKGNDKPGYEAATKQLRAEAWFSDAGGRHWHRLLDGQLERCDQPMKN
jgi:hypothetical protein